jgi:hypothetical protein
MRGALIVCTKYIFNIFSESTSDLDHPLNKTLWFYKKSETVKIIEYLRKVWRYQTSNQNPSIVEAPYLLI